MKKLIIQKKVLVFKYDLNHYSYFYLQETRNSISLWSNGKIFLYTSFVKKD